MREMTAQYIRLLSILVCPCVIHDFDAGCGPVMLRPSVGLLLVCPRVIHYLDAGSSPVMLNLKLHVAVIAAEATQLS